jgi:hypothetical protein
MQNGDANLAHELAFIAFKLPNHKDGSHGNQKLQFSSLFIW